MEYSKKNFGGLRSSFEGLLRTGALLLAVACGCVPAAAQTTEFVELVSANATGTQAGNGRSDRPQSSDDGRFVVFVSTATDLVPNDTNGEQGDVFVRDLQLDTTTLVSVNSAGTASGNGPSASASITPDGRFVIFTSSASDLAAGDTNNAADVFVRDLQTNTTKLVSVNSAGAASGNGSSFPAFLTPDGRYAVFTSNASDLVAGGTSPQFNIYRRDLQTSTTVLVSVNSTGTDGGNNTSTASAVTPDGRFVLFVSGASDLVANDTNDVTTDVFRRDLQTNTTALASVNVAGTGSGNGPSRNGVMSDDGRVVAFESSATNLVAPGGAGTGFTDPSIYARDFAANTTTLVSEQQVFQGGLRAIPPAFQPRISADGRSVFYLRVENGVSGINRAVFRDRVFHRNLLTGTLLELPFVDSGLCDEGFNCRSIVTEFITSRDGRYVAYRQLEQPRSNATPFSTAIVVRDMVGGGAEVITGLPGPPFNFTGPPQDVLAPGSVVAGGKVAFVSGVSHSAADASAFEDVYLFAPPATPRAEFSQAAYDLPEEGPSFPFNAVRVRRNGYLINSTATVKFATADGTAVAGADYVARSVTLTFAPGESEKALSVQVINDEVIDPNETFSLNLSDPTGDFTLGSQSSATVNIADDDPHTVEIRVTGTSFADEERSDFSVSVTVSGNPTQPISVDYSTADGTASERSDYITASGRLTFAPGQRTKRFTIFIVNDGLAEPDETFTVSLSNVQGANAVLGPQSTQQLRILANDSPPPATNPIDESQFFVRQHYLDFLNREPDPTGFQFWTNEIESCGPNAQCREVKRINVSAAFFLSIEFQSTGFLAYLTNKAAFGTRPVFSRFQHDVQNLQRDFIFGQTNPTVLEANKKAFFNEFVARPEFVSKFGGMSNSQYVSTLLGENNLAPTVPNIFVTRLERVGQPPSQPGTTPPAVFILRRDPDPSNNTVRLWLRFNSLTSTITGVHIHRPVANGLSPILHTLPTDEFADRPLTLTNAEIALLNSGQLTIDVHTQNNPGGELIGQLGPIRLRVDVLVNALDNGTLTRAEVLRMVAESEELRRAEFNSAFVLMEYFGYLRRDPDPEGFNFWLGKLNEFNGDFIRAEMVKAFISSAEYRQRFGQ